MIAHLVGALGVLALGRRLGRRALLLAALLPAAAFVWAVVTLATLDGGARVERWRWLPELGLEVGFRVDGLAAVFVLLIGGIGALVFVYAASYLGDGDRPARLGALLLVFAGAMLGLVLADDVLLLFVFWELTSVTSFLLIGTEDERASARAAATQALLITGGGGLCLFAGLLLLRMAEGTSTLSVLASRPPTGSTAAAAVLLIALGALTKSAQAPFHTWLPGAMSAPTPVSAYLHSATMVKAGVYVVARFGPSFAGVGWWRPLVVGAGVASLLVGGWRSLRQTDLKLLLAYSTISQLGLLMVMFGLGSDEAWKYGVVLLVAHATYKAPLFMTVGIVDHAAHTRDLRRLDRLGAVVVGLTVAGGLAAASMAGIPPLLGFVAKEGVLSSLGSGSPAGPGLLLAVVVGSTLSVAAAARFAWGAFGPAEPDPLGHPVAVVPMVEVHRPGRAFVAPVTVLAAFSLVAGLAPEAVLGGVVGQAVGWLEHTGHSAPEDHLALWHGVNAAFAWSMAILVVGGLLWRARARVERLQGSVPALPSAQRAYEGCVSGLLRLADRVTGVTQSGSLPRYVAVLVLVAVVVPGVALAGSVRMPDDAVLADGWVQVVVAVGMVVAALGVVATRQRFAAAILLGAVGYGMAGLFVIQGAPDLAITQLLVETLSIVLFVLVLRRLPERFSAPRIRSVAIGRALASAVVGFGVFAFLLTSEANRVDPGVAPEYVAKALPEGGGNNIVNVIVVDFRGFDTLGEITVLLTAALGAVALVRAGRRDGAGAPDGAAEAAEAEVAP